MARRWVPVTRWAAAWAMARPITVLDVSRSQTKI